MDRIRRSLRRHGRPIRVVTGLLTTAIALWGGFSSDPFFPVLWDWLSDVVATGTLTVPTLTPGQWIALLVALLSLGILLYSFYLDYVAGPENAASARLKLQWPIVVQESESDQVQDKTTRGDGQSGQGAPTATDRYPCTVEGIEQLYHELGDVAASKAGTVINRIKGQMKRNYTDRIQRAVSETERELSDLDKQTNAFRKVLDSDPSPERIQEQFSYFYRIYCKKVGFLALYGESTGFDFSEDREYQAFIQKHREFASEVEAMIAGDGCPRLTDELATSPSRHIARALLMEET